MCGICGEIRFDGVPTEAKTVQAMMESMDRRGPDADGIFITCTNFRCSDVIEEIERDAGIPVVTSNQATAWHLMKLLGINDVVEGYGQLLRKTPRV